MLAEHQSPTPLPLQIIREFGGQENHPKRRRNRTRVSCLNCYASKRKCDRKRPCTRCIKLGLTGLCVYEVEDPESRGRSRLDENTRLRFRIAELESVIRELNYKPHPGLTASADTPHGPPLLPLRHRLSRRTKAGHVRSTSVDEFFAEVVDSVEDVKVKVERCPFPVPDFTPSELEEPASQSSSTVHSPLTFVASIPHESIRWISESFGFANDSYPDGSHDCSPVSSSAQCLRGHENFHLFASSRIQEECLSPAISESSEEDTLLSNPFYNAREAITPDLTCGHSSRSQSSKSFLEEIGGASASIQMAPTLSPTSSVSPPSPSPQHYPQEKKEGICRCLNTSSVLNPLLHFALALRTSREALQSLHAPASNCVLFRRMLDLEDHIFSASPRTPKGSLGHDLGSTTLEPIPLFPTSPVRMLDSPMPVCSRPSSAHSSIEQPRTHDCEPDTLAYPTDPPGCSQPHVWM